MKQIYFLAIGFLIAFNSYAQLTSQTMMVGNTTRSYQQYLPVGFNPQNESPSLVVILHGLGGNSSQMVAVGFNNVADTARVIAIYPQALNNGFGQAAWNNGTLASSTADDIAYMNQLVDKAIQDYNVDPTKVYFTGFSMGSIMSYHVACEMNDRVASIGCMAGTMPTSDIQNCVPTYATPVIHLHGTADGTVPYNSGALPSLSLVPETMDFWKNVHGCSATADSLRKPDLANDGITVDRFRYDNCNPAGSVELWRLNNAGHIYLYQPVNDITEMIEVWLFMRRWTHPTPAPVGLTDQSKVTLTVSPNPSSDQFQISVSQNVDYSITTITGETVQTGKLAIGTNTILLENESAGVYLLSAGNTSVKLMKN